MIRILIFITFVVVAAWGLTLLSGVTGLTVIRFGDLHIDVPTAFLLGLLVTIVIFIIVLTLIAADLMRMPKAIVRRNQDKRREKGILALTRGFEAVAAGDSADAQRHARTASAKLTDETGLTRLLTAQAAQLAGDEDTAEESFSAMLEAPETEFLGLRGLYLQAMTSGDRKEAREYAERAFRLRPGTEWAYQSVYSLHLERGAWGDAREALLQAQRHGHETGEASKRREAALLTAMAYTADAAGDTETARQDALLAAKKAPALTPAVVLAARLEGVAGRRSKASKLLDEAWTASPHPAIAKTMNDLYAHESLERRTERLRKLANTNPLTDESQILLAEQESALGDYTDARDRLEPLLSRTPRARAFFAMAAAIRGLHGSDAAQTWLDRAAAAPLDPVPGVDGDFHFTTDGWQRLIREFGDHGRLAPPLLEEFRTMLSAEDVRLMLAPPEPDAAPDAVVDTDEDTIDEISAANEDAASTEIIDESTSPSDPEDTDGTESDPLNTEEAAVTFSDAPPTEELQPQAESEKSSA